MSESVHLLTPRLRQRLRPVTGRTCLSDMQQVCSGSALVIAIKKRVIRGKNNPKPVLLLVLSAAASKVLIPIPHIPHISPLIVLLIIAQLSANRCPLIVIHLSPIRSPLLQNRGQPGIGSVASITAALVPFSLMIATSMQSDLLIDGMMSLGPLHDTGHMSRGIGRWMNFQPHIHPADRQIRGAFTQIPL